MFYFFQIKVFRKINLSDRINDNKSRIEEIEPNIQIIPKIKLSSSHNYLTEGKNEITPQSYQNKALRSIHEIKSKLLKSLLIVAGSSFKSIHNRANAVDDISSTQTLKGFQTKSGLKYFDIVEGTGAEPRYGQLVSFFYTLYYKAKDKEVEKIDSTADGVPFLHKHGNGRICRGLEEALHTMKVGGTRRAILTKNIGLYFSLFKKKVDKVYSSTGLLIFFNIQGYTDFGIGPLPLQPKNRKRLNKKK